VIHWLIQNSTAHPDLAHGQPPPGLLSVEETAVFDRFKRLKRRQDWLLGRWTAKHLLQEVIHRDRGQRIALDAFSILPGVDGAPMANFDSSFTVHGSPFTISISHSHGTSFCAVVARSNWPLGADIERIESRSANFIAGYFTEEEQEQIRRAVPEMQDVLLTAIWSAKEVALKAIHKGLRVDTRSVSCQIEAPEELPKAWRPYCTRWVRKPDIMHPPELRSWWMISGQYVLTLAAEDDQGSHIVDKAAYQKAQRDK
jgi:4'-phosphopantetheinyl transferase